MDQKEKQQCVICCRQKEEGLQIGDGWICVQCESEIVQTDVGDPKYYFFIQQLKNIGCTE